MPHTLARLLTGLLLLLATAWLSPANAAEPENPIAGVRFDPRVNLGGQTVPLVATGVRAQFIFKGYAAGLYLGKPAGTAEAVVSQPGAKRLQMRLLIDVPMADFAKAFRLGVERNNPPDVQQRLAERSSQFVAQLMAVDKVRKGDTVNLDFLPGTGLQFTLNGKAMGPAVPGDDFYGALLKVFVGEHVSDNKLRAGLLGQKS